MLKLVTDKEEIVRTLLPFVPDTEISDFDYVMKTWWKNIRDTGGLGLTYYGDTVFKKMGLETYEFDFGPNSYFGGIGSLLMLDKYMPCPYYFHLSNKRKYLRIYDGRIATMIMLTGDVYEYIDRIKKRQENEND
jgi:hypothetical protein